ncbi:DUF3857 domain-containing protein [Aequorivita echinoideorum]|uniref:Transglutaminase-like domain-containing protein n=1 Tax=Aequorivita echinoideorum TaxID=1549647 RepID=A0ABS5S478_9FLAO|nr:DUF3857 domain-containing protein [Aequorivita echinoideorum]MBT0606655.1 transglutaminase-like domain-containing protein [Aequorivita echinoideorum]
MKKLILITLILTTFGLYSQESYTISGIPIEFLKKSNSILINEIVETDVTDISKMKVKTHSATAVLNKMGDKHAQAYAFYDDYTKIKNIEVFVYDANGKELEHFKKRDFKDVSRGDGISIYNDDRVLYLDYTPTTYPYILVFNAETESKDSGFISPWYPVGGYARGTMKSVAKLSYSPENKPKHTVENIDGFAIEVQDANNQITCTATNIKPIDYEEYSVGFMNIAPKVNFALDQFYLKGTKGYGKDWRQFGEWMDKSLLTDVRDLPEGTIARVKSLVANETTNEGKARKVYQFVQDKVRYVSIQIGIGGWKPMLASDVDNLSYGDCKALTNYTKALLEAVGVPSYYSVLWAGEESERNIMKDFASIQGNHAFLAIPDGDTMTWLECTSQDTPYGFIGDFADDRDVLVITPEGGKIVHTKAYGVDENTQESKATVSVAETGDVSANFKSISKGLQYEDKFLLPKKKQDEIDKHYKNKWSNLNGVSFSEINFDNNKEEIVFTEDVALSIPHYANAVGKDYLFCPNIFNQNSHIPPRIENRKQNLHLSKGFMDIDTVEIEIPENFSFDSLPDATVIENKFGKYSIDFKSVSENKIEYKRKLIINKGTYAPSEYENYREFCRTISKLDRTKLLLRKN